MKITLNNVQLIATRGDIANQPDVDAIVNAANAELKIGGGVAGAIHRAAGPDLYQECRPLAPLHPGEAVITGAYDLPNKYVIHCLGPVYGKDYPSDVLLANCYSNALNLAKENQIASIAFPAISTGAFEFPFEEATTIAFDVILKELKGMKHIQKIKFVLHGENDLRYYREYLEKVNKPS